MINKVEKNKVGIRAKFGLPFRLTISNYSLVKVLFGCLKKDTAQLVTQFAASNLWMALGKPMGARDNRTPKSRETAVRSKKSSMT